MADKDAFLARVDEQLDRLKTWQDEMDAEVKRRRQEIMQLRARRSTRLTEVAASLLPDLRPATLHRLQEKLPDALTARQVDEMREAHVQALEAQKRDLLAKFDPATHKSRRLRLENELEQEKGYQESVDRSLTNWTEIPGFQTLIERGYGTPAYRQSWMTLDYYRHWKRADEIAENFKVKGWPEVLAKYQDLKASSRRMAATRADLEKQIADLDRNLQYLEELTQAAGHVDEAVLEKARTKLIGLMDNLNPRPSWMSDLQEIDAAITANQKAVDEGLQGRREKIAEQTTQLQDLRLRVVRSGKREVPDEYMNNLPVSRPGVTPVSGPIVYLDSGRNDFITDFIYYKTMMDFFDTPHHHHHDRWSGSSSSFDSDRRRDWSSPREDRVGRLS